MHNQLKLGHLKNFSGLQIESAIAKALKELTNSEHEIEMITFQVERSSDEVKIVFYARQSDENG